MQKSFLLFIISILLLSSCKKDKLLTDTSAKLDFSRDSILFDTVFTTLGSVTKTFRIYNNHNQAMNISRIHLATGNASPFKLNVDGVSGKSITDVEILANDSLFVFVQVTINPQNSSPLLVPDEIIFETNGNIQQVYLTAIGQNVYLHKPDHFPTNGFPPYSIIHCNDIWTNDKPHLIFGYAVVDSACTLTMQPGTRVYLHNNSCLFVYKDGTLNIAGSLSNKVSFQGDRLETDYANIPGQYRGIWLSKGSTQNKINYAVLKNGAVGIQVDSLGADAMHIPTLRLTNTIIKTMQFAGLYAQGAWIRSNNCVFADCGSYSAGLAIGGNYNFEQCTFANYWNSYTAVTGGSANASNNAQRTTPLLAINNFYIDRSGTTQVRTLDSANFTNCIFYGDMAEEIALDSSALAGAGYFHYLFTNCLVRTAINTANGHFYFPLVNQDPQFKDPGINNYELLSGSPAINAGSSSVIIPLDLNGNQRPNPTGVSLPDIGAYEYYP